MFVLTFYVIYKLLVEIRYLNEEIDSTKHEVYLLQDESTIRKAEIAGLKHSITILQDEAAYFDTHINKTRKEQDGILNELNYMIKLLREVKRALEANEKIELDTIKEIESSNLVKNEEVAEIKNSITEIKNSKNVKPKKKTTQKPKKKA
mgnify:CR=1 FL=1